MDTASKAARSLSDDSFVSAGIDACSNRLLGLIVPELVNSCVTGFFRQFEDAASLQGFDLLIGTVAADNSGADALVHHMIQREVKGVAVLTNTLQQLLIDSFLQHDIRLIRLAPAHPSTHTDAIEVDIVEGANQAVQHLAVLGHRNIVFVQSRNDFLEISPEAFSKAMSNIGVQVARPQILQQPLDCKAGPGLLQQLLSLPAFPTGIVCSGDLVALKLMRALQAGGIDVPRDVSITGFGDLSLAARAHPPLTTVQISQHDVVNCANCFLRSIHNRRGNSNAKTHGVGATLVARQSTTFPRSAIQRHAWLSGRLARKASRKML